MTPPNPTHPLLTARFDTPLGVMVAIADNTALYLLEFTDRRGLEREVERLRERAGSPIVPGRTAVIEQIEAEMRAYFAGELTAFQTPLAGLGTPFQRSVWAALQAIPYGQTRTYAELAAAIGKPSAVRAAGRANGANPCAIIVPCHRVIGANGDLTGYGAGIERKRWLIAHERSQREA